MLIAPCLCLRAISIANLLARPKLVNGQYIKSSTPYVLTLKKALITLPYIACLAIASISYVSKQFDSEPILSYSIGLPSLPKFVTVVHSSLYSHKTARTCSEPSLVERKLSFAVEAITASGNWKHLLPLKIILVPVSIGYHVLEMADTYLRP